MPEAIAAEAVKPKPEKLPNRCLPSTFKFMGQDYEDIDVTMPVGHTVEDALRPEYWANVAYLVSENKSSGRPDRRGSLIRLRREDHTLYAVLYIRAVRENGIEVGVVKPGADGVSYFGPNATNGNGAGAYETRWNVGGRGYDIIRKTDNTIVGHARDFPLKEDALAWIAKMKG